MENRARNFLARSSKLEMDFGGRLSNHLMAVLVRVVGKALQRTASEASVRYILLLKLLRWWLGSEVPSYRVISGSLKSYGILVFIISLVNGF